MINNVEPLNAKIRNKLTPFWTLTELMSDDEKWVKFNSTEEGRQLIKDMVAQCNLNKEIILNLIDEVK